MMRRFLLSTSFLDLALLLAPALDSHMQGTPRVDILVMSIKDKRYRRYKRYIMEMKNKKRRSMEICTKSGLPKIVIYYFV